MDEHNGEKETLSSISIQYLFIVSIHLLYNSFNSSSPKSILLLSSNDILSHLLIKICIYTSFFFICSTTNWIILISSVVFNPEFISKSNNYISIVYDIFLIYS